MQAEHIGGLDQLLTRLADMDGTDLFLAVGSPPMAGVHGDLVPLRREPLTVQAIEALVAPVLRDPRAEGFEARPDLDIAHVIPGKGRFRLNVFRQRGHLGLVARRIKGEVPSLESLKLPPVLKDMARLAHGLVLVTGATGSGKSTTLAAMIDHRNASLPGHIVTIEDPIEFVHTHKRSIVSQREVGTDTAAFEDALRSALRQAPSMVLIGEIRDRETAEAALHMSETGHLVLATLHSTNAAQTLNRFTTLFPETMREQICMLLALELGGIVAQRLLVTRDRKGRAAALEVMVPTPRVRHLVARGEIDAVRTTMAEAKGADGMQTFEESLAQLVMAGRVSVAEAVAHADSPANLRLRLRQEQLRRGSEAEDEKVDLRML